MTLHAKLTQCSFGAAGGSSILLLLLQALQTEHLARNYDRLNFQLQHSSAVTVGQVQLLQSGSAGMKLLSQDVLGVSIMELPDLELLVLTGAGTREQLNPSSVWTALLLSMLMSQQWSQSSAYCLILSTVGWEVYSNTSNRQL
jgi:hypothetical protein